MKTFKNNIESKKSLEKLLISIESQEGKIEFQLGIGSLIKKVDEKYFNQSISFLSKNKSDEDYHKRINLLYNRGLVNKSKKVVEEFILSKGKKFDLWGSIVGTESLSFSGKELKLYYFEFLGDYINATRTAKMLDSDNKEVYSFYSKARKLILEFIQKLESDSYSKKNKAGREIEETNEELRGIYSSLGDLASGIDDEEAFKFYKKSFFLIDESYRKHSVSDNLYALNSIYNLGKNNFNLTPKIINFFSSFPSDNGLFRKAINLIKDTRGLTKAKRFLDSKLKKLEKEEGIESVVNFVVSNKFTDKVEKYLGKLTEKDFEKNFNYYSNLFERYGNKSQKKYFRNMEEERFEKEEVKKLIVERRFNDLAHKYLEYGKSQNAIKFFEKSGNFLECFVVSKELELPSKKMYERIYRLIGSQGNS